MSNKPNPVALTACILARRLPSSYETAYTAAQLASDLHRLAPAVQRHAVAMCNGEWREGQRDSIQRIGHGMATWLNEKLGELDESIAKYGERLARRIERLNANLAAFDVRADASGDPRGCVLRLVSLDPEKKPLPSNIGSNGEWGIA